MINRLAIAVCLAFAVGGTVFGEGGPAEKPAPEQLPAPAPADKLPATDNKAPALAPAVPDGPPVTAAHFGESAECGCHEPRVWFGSDYLFYWFPSQPIPPLITTSPAGTARTSAGVLGQPGTSTLFGGFYNGDLRSGLHLETGAWFDDHHEWGIEAGAMMLESESTGAAFNSNGTPILARPFSDATNGSIPDSVLIAFPGSSSGNIAAVVKSGNFYEAHVDLLQNVVDHENVRVDALLGYRFYRYDEAVHVNQTVVPTGSGFVPGTTITTADDFAARNSFNGGDFGLRTRFNWGPLSADVLTKLSVGDVGRRLTTGGGNTVAVPGQAPVVTPAGFLVLSTNSGQVSPHDFEIMPEFGLTLSYQVARGLKLHIGYSLIGLDGIARAGNQINLQVNPNLLPSATSPSTGPLQPSFSVHRSDIWVQGISLGADFTF